MAESFNLQSTIYKNTIDNIYKNVIKINNFQEISKDSFPVRLENLSNEEKNEIKLFRNSTSYSVDEELIDVSTVKIRKKRSGGLFNYFLL